MKSLLLGGAACLALAVAVYAQTPTATPETPAASPTLSASAAPAASVAPAATIAPAVSASPSAANQFADQIKERVERKFRHGKHGKFAVTIDGNDKKEVDVDDHDSDDHDIPKDVFPIVAICMIVIFGFPVAIVAVIMASSWAKARSLHRTVRMMVEKGQPIPPALFATPGAVAAASTMRPWYDLRRGIMLMAVGVGLIMFFGISAGWDEGVWALGLIPGLIGIGYILAWRLAYREEKALKQ